MRLKIGRQRELTGQSLDGLKISLQPALLDFTGYPDVILRQLAHSADNENVKLAAITLRADEAARIADFVIANFPQLLTHKTSVVKHNERK